MNDSQILSSCPFCGGEAFPNIELTKHWIECRECAAESGCYRTEAEAIAAWNARAERTCKPTEEGCCPHCGEDIIKCDVAIGAGGGAVELEPPMYHNYCPSCGAKVIGG